MPPRKQSSLERGFEAVARSVGLQIDEREYRFDAERRFRFDFAWPSMLVAVELQGSTWVAGRHTRGAGYAKDCEKSNLAALQGWSVLRYTSDDLRSRPVQVIEEVAELLRLKQGYASYWRKATA